MGPPEAGLRGRRCAGDNHAVASPLHQALSLGDSVCQQSGSGISQAAAEYEAHDPAVRAEHQAAAYDLLSAVSLDVGIGSKIDRKKPVLASCEVLLGTGDLPAKVEAGSAVAGLASGISGVSVKRRLMPS